MRRAFTLIEVLVAISIIALLLAILLPALAGARITSKQTKALANGRSIAQSFATYLNDYDDTYPFIGAGSPFGGGGEDTIFFRWYPENTMVGISPHFEGMAWAWPAVVKHVAPWEEHYPIWVSPGMDTTLPEQRSFSSPEEPDDDISWRYANSFVGDPMLWDPSGQVSGEYRAVRTNEVLHTSGKVLLWDAHLAYLPEEPESKEGHWDARTPMAFADGHGDVNNPLDATEGVPNPLNSGRSDRLHNTPGGVRGVDY